MAIAPPSSPFNLFSVNDQTHIPSFFNITDDGDESQVQLLLDAAFAEELQFQEVLKASLSSCQMPSLHVAEKGESSLSSCEICWERKEDEQLIKNGACSHSFCPDCINNYLEVKIRKGITIVTCPGINCECVLMLDNFKHLLSKDVTNLLEIASPSTELIPDVTCSSKELQVKTNLEQSNRKCFTARRISHANWVPADSKQIVLGKKRQEPAERNTMEDFILQPKKFQSAMNYSCNSQSRFSLWGRNEGPKSVYKHLKNMASLTTGSTPCRSSPEKVADDVKYIPAFDATAAAANDDDMGDSDSDVFPDTDSYDSEASPRSSETCKKSKWFKKFVNGLDDLSIEETKDLVRQWHCPACQGGAGAIKRYLGVQTLIQHAKAKGSTRMRLHRELAQLLEEKLRGDQATSATPYRIACAKWKGLKEEQKDHEIVWPPMVFITNTIHKKDENNKWIGMTTEELLDMFRSYDAIVKAQHAYNWKGHCGMSILIFESSAKGYLEAERLHNHFAEEGTDRNAWHSRSVYFLPGGERQLYGYMAVKQDVDLFNRNAGRTKLKYEMRSYQEMVVNRIRQMTEDNHQLLWLKNRVAELQRQTNVLEESNYGLKEKLCKAAKEMDILRLKSNQQYEQSMEELEFQEQFYKEQIRSILEARKGKEEDLENTDQENMQQSNAKSSDRNDNKYMKEEIRKPTENQAIEKEGVSESSNKLIIQEEDKGNRTLRKVKMFDTVMRRRLLQTKPVPGGAELPDILEQSSFYPLHINDYNGREEQITKPMKNQEMEKTKSRECGKHGDEEETQS
eukprot:XP_015570881.1 protein SUPPRESSOR OF GENE SILENCING 3 homolog [Ricinus communis]